jgi:hypothetical protein
MKLIPLTQGYFAKVSDEDFEFLSQWKWCVHIDKTRSKTFYAKRKIWVNGKSVDIRMHRVIMGAAKGFEVDHRDRDGLNNQRENLRIATKSQNQWNQRPYKIGSSKYKGVMKDKRIKKKPWIAKITVNNVQIILGSYKEEIEAAKAYDYASFMYHGEFGYRNFHTASEPVEK